MLKGDKHLVNAEKKAEQLKCLLPRCGSCGETEEWDSQSGGYTSEYDTISTMVLKKAPKNNQRENKKANCLETGFEPQDYEFPPPLTLLLLYF